MCSVNFLFLFLKNEAKELKPGCFLVGVGGAFNFFGEPKHPLSGLGSKFVICPSSVDKTQGC